MNKPLPDSIARERLAHELETSFFVEAGAGSGKTESMVARMVNLVKTGQSEIESISAVTFTRKAAAELRERFQNRLEENLHKADTSESEKAYIQKALGNFERLSISTIHSFCAGLLRERPVEASIDPGFTEIEEDENISLAKQSWAEFVEKCSLSLHSMLPWLREQGINPEKLEDIYLTCVANPDVEVLREKCPCPEFKLEAGRIKQFLLGIQKRMPEVEPDDGWDKLQEAVLGALKLISMGFLLDNRRFVVVLKNLSKELKVVQKRWDDKEVAKACAAEMLHFQETVIIPLLDTWKEYLHKPLMDFVLEGAAYYAKWREQNSLVNFQDLLMKTTCLLRDYPEVRATFQERIRFLLVDEFQDTDPIQAELVFLLMGTDITETNWRKSSPKPGSIFLVGDPKQSIYRFRRADIDIYNDVKNLFKEGLGAFVELTTNFRSLDPILNLANTVFSNIFQTEANPYQANFVALTGVRGSAINNKPAVYENIIEPVAGNNPEAAANADAIRLANWIDWSLKGNLQIQEKRLASTREARPGDFMIITKKKKYIALYAQALEKLGIPYEISGGESFGDSTELAEILKVLKAIIDPRNQVALLAALRGLFFGVSDAELFEFVNSGGHFSFFQKAEAAPESIRTAFACLRELQIISSKQAPLAALELIIEKLSILPLAVSREMGSSRAGNIFKALELLSSAAVEQNPGFATLVEELQLFLEEGKIEEMGLFSGTPKAVQILNLHKAKGLEAPVVMLADPLGSGRNHEPDLHVQRTGNKSLGYFTITIPKAQYGEFNKEIIAQPLNWEKASTEEILYTSAEAERLDYVAVTRACNILIVSTYHKGDRRKPWENLYEALKPVPKLEAFTKTAPLPKQTLSIQSESWLKETATISGELKAVCTPTYTTTSVTATLDKTAFYGGSSTDGTGWGNIVHQALEACGRGQRAKLDILAKNWLIDYQRSPEELPRLLELVDKIIQGPFWARLAKASEKYFELPFTIQTDNTVLSGAIDLVFKEADGWVLVDYKTGSFEDDPAKKAVYEKQIGIYAEYWEEITGERVKEKRVLGVGLAKSSV